MTTNPRAPVSAHVKKSSAIVRLHTLRPNVRSLLPILAILITSIFMGNAEASPTITVESPLSWLQVIPPADPQFQSRLRETVGPTIAGSIGPVLPYSILVVQNGSETLVGIDVRFTVKLRDRTVYRN